MGEPGNLPAQAPGPQEWLALSQAHQAELTAFLGDLVRIPSVNGRDSEQALAERIAQEAGRLGLPSRLVAAQPGRPNLLVEWGRGPQGFALVGHMDTVAPGDLAGWSHPPFAAEIEVGRLIGRGAADNKAGLACGLYTLAILARSGILNPEQHRLILAGVVDEESGASSPWGVRYLLNQDLLPVQGAIYTYTSDIVCIGHRGLLRVVLSARGRAIHSGSPAWSRGETGVNAVTGLADLLLGLEKLDLRSRDHPDFPGMKSVITPGTLFQGGEFESIVPAHAEAMVDIRLLPGQTADEVLGLIRAEIERVCAVRPGLKVELRVKNDLPAAIIPRDHRLARLAEHYTATYYGAAWPVEGAGPANEGYMLIGHGIPTLCGFGPTGGNAHAADEWVALDSLAVTTAIYCAMLSDYLN